MAEEKKKKNFLLSNIVMIPVVVSILVGSFSGVNPETTMRHSQALTRQRPTLEIAKHM